ncbi:MAG: SdrD B-like domain-containing protein [Peptoniphilus harei]|uniref:SdrD B-like domain-containing protein n=1 Tax=Peptoniphilus harei TaxID=54005 RepID=UPI0029053BC4|nr:SdrD B-like domain-containing protein [Peptoniphilus harei]MDU3086852.1 SdrD B-like domain-containing protein [Peptoniphilus harei]
MENLREFIEKKKEKSASRKPRYGTRKLSVGLVSCVLGYCIFFSPTVVSAQVGEGASEASSSTSTEARADVSGGNKDTESADSKETKAVESPQAEAPAAEEKSETVVVEAPAAEVSEKEETREAEANVESLSAEKENEIEQTTPKAEENKDTLESEDDKEVVDEEQQADVEEAAKKEVPAEVDEESKEEATEAETPLAEKEALGISEEIKQEAQQAGETVEDAITNVEITIGGAKNGANTEIVNPTALPERTNGGNTDINLEAQVDFDIPEGTKHGKTFDFVVSDNVNLHGVLESKTVGEPVVFDGEEIATAEKLTDGRNGYKYTFNEKVDGLKDIRVRIIYPLFIDPDKVPMGTKEYEIGEDGKYVLDEDGNPVVKADHKETVSVTVADKTASKDYTVEYESEVFDIKNNVPTLSGIADIDQVTDNNYNHTIYVNPTADQMLNGSHVTVQNEKGYNTITFDEGVKNSVKVYKVKNPNKLPLSFGNNFDDGNYEDVTSKANVKLVKDANNADLNKLVVDVKQGNTNQSQPFDNKDFDKSAYVITYTGKRTPDKAFKTNTIYTADWRKANGNAKNLSKLGDQSWEWTNEIVIDDAEAIAIANKTYSLGDKVWIDADEDGSQGDSEKGLEGVKVILKGINMSDRETTTDANGNYNFDGLRNGEYTVEFEIPTGYAPTTAKAENVKDEKNSDASQAQGAKVAIATGEINCADNMNVDFGVVKSNEGSFTEHHVYEVYKDGELQDTSYIDIETTTGTDKETFTTSAKPNGTADKVKEGFKLVPEKITKSDEITETITGGEVTRNYINEKELQVTYVYRKDIKTWTPEKTQTEWTPIEETGKFQEHHVYRTLDKDGKVIKEEKVDGDVTGGTSKMTYTTGKIDKEGFDYKRIETPVEDPTFKEDGSKVTGNFKPGVTQEITYVYEKTVKDETPTPVTPPTPEEPKHTTPLVPLTPAEEVEVERITHHDHKTPGTPVVTEVPSTPVVETEKSVEEKTEKSEETKEVENKEEKAEKVEEIKEEAKTVEDDNLEKPQAPENHDKVAPRAPEKDKAPKTGDAGILSSLGLGSLAASGLAFIELRKRNKKNK